MIVSVAITWILDGVGESKRNVTLLYICVTFQADFEETVQVECYISRDIE